MNTDIEYFLDNWMPAGGRATRQAFESDLAKLILNHEIAARDAGTSKEREACAELADDYGKQYLSDFCRIVAKAIRERRS